ncbi:MAG TPA: TIM barrel protein [Terriglobia bacterium]
MSQPDSHFHFASAPVSWGIGDIPDAAWQALPYERVLDEIAAAGYSGTELGPYGYFPTDAGVLSRALAARRLTMLSSFVPVPLSNPQAADSVVQHIRKVGSLLAALGAHVLVLADAQSPARVRLAGRVPVDGSQSLRSEQWRQVGRMVAEVERAAAEFGLGLVFHPHVATYVETPAEVERFFEAVSATRTGLCLDTGHCVYGGGDPLDEARKYRPLLRYIHIKDIDAPTLGKVRRQVLDFGQAVAAGVFSQVGRGCIGFAEFFRWLQAEDYSGWLIVEQDVKYGETAVAPLESMRLSLDYLKSVVASLGTSTSQAASR